MNDEFKSLLPPNASKLLRDLEKTGSRLSFLEILNRYLRNPEKCPEHLLPWLGWALSVDVWNETWAESIRRNVIKASISVHRHKGTLGALKRALEAFEFDHVTIEEWFDYGGNPYTFRVFIEVVTEGFDINDLTEVQAVINQTKNVRSHLEMLRAFLCTTSETPRLGNAFSTGEITTIYGLEVFEI
ncbi:MAG: phage tail protein I [Azospirillum sp. 47_25]|nr:MAG: phage tail protein I [Azospirillum sp. 47_25]